MTAPLILVNAVGMTSRLLAHAPRMRELAEKGWLRPLDEVLPAVTCTAQASMLTGKQPEGHGIVGNGWLYRDTAEVRFWQQSNRLLRAEPVYETLRRDRAARGKPFTCAKLFWWFNQGAAVDFSLTPKPYYGADGNKVFGVYGTPDGLAAGIEKRIGVFPFHTFWGPAAGLPCTQWIAQAAGEVIWAHRPDLTLVYLPHLDYEPQRHGPAACVMGKLVGQLDDALQPICDAAKEAGARLWIVSEYGHCDVKQPVYLNRLLRRERLLEVRPGPFGETLDTFASQAFAVVDHQLAHVYVREQKAVGRVADFLRGLPGVGKVLAGDERSSIGLCHERAGEIVALSKADSWFAYPYWDDDRQAPDFARTVDIHRKPGYDPCELFLDPGLWWPKGRVIRRLLRKKLGFRTLFDVIPLDAALVRGSHGLPAEQVEDRPILIGDGQQPEPRLCVTDVHALLRRELA